MTRSVLSYQKWPIIITIIGLALSGWLGWVTTGTLSGLIGFLVIGGILATLEIALSFDNAIVNANKLVEMTPIWQRRFLTWGILIAVFGMRIIFPLAIVSIFAWINPFAAMHLALSDPDQYSYIIEDAHSPISAFGGTFLMMVALKFFVNEEKSIDWFVSLEKSLRKFGYIKGFEIVIVLFVIIGVCQFLPETKHASFLMSALCGLLIFMLVDGLGSYLDGISRSTTSMTTRGGLGAFLYLEVLDASFSFDGVIGAFALTTNILLIAIGLGIGAMYVRSMTIMLVERGTLAEFRYLEHGAFYSIFVLSVIMFLQSLFHVPELITGGIGFSLIGLAFYRSIQYNKNEAVTKAAAGI